MVVPRRFAHDRRMALIPRTGLWQAAAVAVALVLAFGGGTVAKAKYDAQNAHKVDGKHAVPAGAPAKKLKGALVATDKKTGKLPDSVVAAAPVLAIPPQGAGVGGNATRDMYGVTLMPSGGGELRFGFVVPPGHQPKRPLEVDVVYREDSPGACSWWVYTSGLEGPDAETGPDIHNGGWQFPGSGGFHEGLVTVPAGEGMVHTLTLTWPFQHDPGMFIQLGLARNGDDPADTCGSVSVYGIQVRY